MHLRLILAAALAVGLSTHAQAQQQWPGVTVYDNKGVPLGTAANPLAVTGGTGGGGSSGSVTAPGTAGTQAQAVQGVPGGVPQNVTQAPTSAFSIAKTTGIGTTAVQVSAADTTNRRTVTNTSALACEIMPGATAYGTGYPLPAGGSFTFDASGRTTAAIFVACSAAGGTATVLSF